MWNLKVVSEWQCSGTINRVPLRSSDANLMCCDGIDDFTCVIASRFSGASDWHVLFFLLPDVCLPHFYHTQSGRPAQPQQSHSPTFFLRNPLFWPPTGHWCDASEAICLIIALRVCSTASSTWLLRAWLSQGQCGVVDPSLYRSSDEYPLLCSHH